MSVKKYIRKKNTRLTTNFGSKEFDCKGTSCRCTVTRIDSKLSRKLQILRNKLGKTIIINSGNRCPKHNAAVGGTASSYHLNTKGKAADIRVEGVTPEQLAKAAQDVGFSGVGCYSGTAGHFVHVDTRAGVYYWKNTAGKNITAATHGGKKEKCPHTLGGATIKKGSTGESVKALQWILNWAGYTCTVDGSFGAKTETALKAFQADMLLTADGIAGKETLAALKEVAA